MPLTILDCSGSLVSDLTPLQGMKLNVLAYWSTQVSDLSPLRGMPLTTLNFVWTKVSDLSPLEGMPLTKSLSENRPRRGGQAPFAHRASQNEPVPAGSRIGCNLYFNGTPVSDLTPLQGMNLSEVCLTPRNIKKGMAKLRKISRLTSIGLGSDEKEKFAPSEFWKKYEAGEFK